MNQPNSVSVCPNKANQRFRANAHIDCQQFRCAGLRSLWGPLVNSLLPPFSIHFKFNTDYKVHASVLSNSIPLYIPCAISCSFASDCHNHHPTNSPAVAPDGLDQTILMILVGMFHYRVCEGHIQIQTINIQHYIKSFSLLASFELPSIVVMIMYCISFGPSFGLVLV